MLCIGLFSLKKGLFEFSHALRVNVDEVFNPLTNEDFHVFEGFSAFTRPIGFRDSIF